MGFALRKMDLPHYTYQDYLQWEGRWELIDGVPYSLSETKEGMPQGMSPAPNTNHQRINTKILTQLEQLFQDCKDCAVFMFIDWKINEDTVFQPDALVVCGNIGENFLTIVPSVIFEILSPSTSKKDKITKYEFYQKEGVKYYIIVDPDTKSAEVFELKDKTYSKTIQATKEKVKLDIGKCIADFDFSKIWN